MGPLSGLWQYLWRLDRQTRQVMRMHPPALVKNLPGVTPEERKLASLLESSDGQETNLSQSDQSNSEGRVKTNANGNSGGGGGDGDGSAFDIDDYGLRQKIGLILGPLVFGAILLAPNPQGLSPAGQAVAASTAWIAIWWMTVAIPIPATSLLPIVLFPLTGALTIDATTTPYADPLNILFLGGFFIAVAMQRWGLHRRIALNIIRAIGTKPDRIILGFMVATGFLSMWVSNTATTMMMTPIGLAVILQSANLIEEQDKDIPTEQGKFRFGTGLMLCIAYSASLGGVATIIGTPPNAVLVGAINQTFGRDISFFQWMTYGLPVAIVGIAIVWVYVTKFHIPPRMNSLPGGTAVIEEELEKLGSINREEKLVLIVFTATAIAWVSRPFVLQSVFPEIDDATIAILGALILFLLPARTEDGERTFVLDWSTAVRIPWGIILLLGSGFAIAAAFQETGLDQWIGSLLTGLQEVPIVVIITLVVALTIFLTEVSSNTATSAMMMPIMASVAIGLSFHPYVLMIAAATAASFAFMFPVATPPNAIVFGSGYITMPRMVKTGSGLNLIGILLITLIALTWLPFIWGVNIGQLPPWAG